MIYTELGQLGPPLYGFTLSEVLRTERRADFHGTIAEILLPHLGPFHRPGEDRLRRRGQERPVRRLWRYGHGQILPGAPTPPEVFGRGLLFVTLDEPQLPHPQQSPA